MGTLLTIPLDSLFLGVAAIIAGVFTITKGWKEFVRGEVDKEKEKSVGAAAIETQNGKITEIKEELTALKKCVQDNAELKSKVEKLDQDFKDLLQTSLRYWQERGRF